MSKPTFGDNVITNEGHIGKITGLDPNTFLDRQVSFDETGVTKWYPHAELSLYDLENDHDN